MILNWWLHPNGYLVTRIKDPQKRTILQHRLIWEIYRGPIPEGGVIHHKNGIPSDNRIENLELIPSSSAHKTRHYHEEKALGVVKNCPHCQQEFVAFGVKQYCSKKCKDAAWQQRNTDKTAAACRRYRARRKAA